jgi:integrase
VRGSLTDLGNGSWRLRVYVGQGHRRSKNFKGGKRAAQDALRAFITEVQTNGAAPITMGALIQGWWEHAEFRLRPSTLKAYRNHLDNYILPMFGTMQVVAVTPRVIDMFYMRLKEKGLAPATVHHIHAILCSAFTQAEKWGWCVSPMKKTTPPSVPLVDRQAIPPADVRRLIAEAPPLLSAAITLAALTGARRGELCALRWSDLEGSTLHIFGSKTAQVRRIHVDDTALAVLAELRQGQLELAQVVGVPLVPDPFILSHSARGQLPWSPDGVTNAFYKLTRRLGMTWRFHDLRHYAATQLIGAGVNPRTVATRLGHADESTTLRVYAHAIEDRDREAAVILERTLVRPLGESP